MNLSEFRASAIRHATAAACEIIGVDPDYYADTSTAAVWLYAGDCYIEELESGEFHLLIGREEWVGKRGDLEARLYFEHFVSECLEFGPLTLEKLIELLSAWSQWRGLKLASADEMLADLVESPTYNSDRTWLEWYLREWEDAERRDAGRHFGNRA
jgi:hypothetical protein